MSTMPPNGTATGTNPPGTTGQEAPGAAAKSSGGTTAPAGQ
jgi:hypothetical protein